MYELRWILLAAGILLVGGLWIWEWYRTRQATRSVPEARQAQERIEPRVVDSAEPAVRTTAIEVPSIRPSASDRVAPPQNPPVVEIPHGVEPELDRLPRIRPDDTLAGTLPKVDPVLVQSEQRQPWVRTQPLDLGRRPEAAVAARPESPQEPATDAAAAKGASKQKIVALRVVSPGERWPGRAVTDALEAEGLRFGRYSIYHCQRDDGKSLFFVASMVEPGSFDPENIDETSFPGISMFAVLPGPLDAPTTFDQMLAAARRLAERLGGQVQDEHGSSLTAQRVLSLREELAHFEHLSSKLRAR